MEHSYWLGRRRASLANAASASCGAARLVHYDLAGRYSLRADAAAPPRAPHALSPPRPTEAAYYGQLETGARWLAARAGDAAERHRHLGMANRYAALRLVTADAA